MYSWISISLFLNSLFSMLEKMSHIIIAFNGCQKQTECRSWEKSNATQLRSCRREYWFKQSYERRTWKKIITDLLIRLWKISIDLFIYWMFILSHYERRCQFCTSFPRHVQPSPEKLVLVPVEHEKAGFSQYSFVTSFSSLLMPLRYTVN